MIKKILQWQSLGHLLRERAEKIGAQTLLRFEGESMSLAQVEEGNLKPTHTTCATKRLVW